MSACGATVEIIDATLTCTLDEGHMGPTHSDEGHEWGDIDLPLPEEED